MGSNYTFFICKETDNEEILSLLESNPLGNKLQLIYTARPSYFEAQKHLGKRFFVLGARDEHGKLVGIGTICVQKRYVQKKLLNIGYLSHMRVDRNHRGRGIASMGINHLRKIRKHLGVDLFMTSLLLDNKKAVSILTKKRKNYPNLFPVGDIYTKLISLRWYNPVTSPPYAISVQKYLDIKGIRTFLEKHQKEKNFFPYLDILDHDNKTYVIAKKEEKIVGLLSLWDQSHFKQVIINNYTLSISLWRFLFNLRAFVQRTAFFPSKKESLQFLSVSNIIVENNDPDILNAMLQFTTNLYDKKMPFIVIGFHTLDPLVAVLKNYQGISYKSKLFIVSWDDITHLRYSLKNKIFYPEIAIL